MTKNVDGPLLKIIQNKQGNINDNSLNVPKKKSESSSEGTLPDFTGITYN